MIIDRKTVLGFASSGPWDPAWEAFRIHVLTQLRIRPDHGQGDLFLSAVLHAETPLLGHFGVEVETFWRRALRLTPLLSSSAVTGVQTSRVLKLIDPWSEVFGSDAEDKKSEFVWKKFHKDFATQESWVDPEDRSDGYNLSRILFLHRHMTIEKMLARPLFLSVVGRRLVVQDGLLRLCAAPFRTTDARLLPARFSGHSDTLLWLRGQGSSEDLPHGMEGV